MSAPDRGFTLIEILVVLVIMGLMAGAMVMIGSDNREDIARDEIEKLNAKIKIALEEAQLYGVEYGLQVSETEYQFVSFSDDRWAPLTDDLAYRRYRLPDGFELALEIEGFKLPGARLPGARITDKGEVIAESRKTAQRKPGSTVPDKDRGAPTDSEGTEQAQASDNSETEPDADSDEENPLLPQVFLLSSGELNPFVLAIGNRDRDPVFFRLRGNYDGEIKLEGPIRADPVDDLTIPWDNPDPAAAESAEEDGAETDTLMQRDRDTDRRNSDRRNGDKSRDGKATGGDRDASK